MMVYSNQYKEVHAYVDGGSRHNPGKAAVAYIIADKEDRVLKTGNRYIGIRTNNEAEYEALISGLNEALSITKKRILCFSDSNLVINQMNGIWRITKDHLQVLWNEAHAIARQCEETHFTHLSRTNSLLVEADSLVNEVLDAEGD